MRNSPSRVGADNYVTLATDSLEGGIDDFSRLNVRIARYPPRAFIRREANKAFTTEVGLVGHEL
jgi:hypothetical protein